MKFEHNTSIGEAVNPFGTEFENFPLRGHFSKKCANFDTFPNLATSGRYNSTMITYRRKFIIK